MKPRVRQWHDIAETYRAEAWADAARLARARVDQDPHDVSTRVLLASLLVRARQRALALMQYERALPLAVGQGDLFCALGTQRHLDELHPAAQRHPDRYRAIQDWFRAFVAARPARTGHGPAERVQPRALLDLPAEVFTRVAEQAAVVPLEMGPQMVSDAGGVLWVVYFGRIRWAIVTGEDGAPESFTAEEGDIILLPPGEPSTRWLEIEAVLPSEVIRFDPGLTVLLDGARHERLAEDETGGALPVSPAAPTGDEARPASVTAAPTEARAPVLRPRPDPLAEPTLAMGAPRERRRQHRMAVLLDTRAALLGEAGTRIAPVDGRVVDVSDIGMGLAFPAGRLRQPPGIHPDAMVFLQVGLHAGEERVPVTGRVAWIDFTPSADPSEAGEARVGIEFVAMSAENRSRLAYLLDTAARSGS